MRLEEWKKLAAKATPGVWTDPPDRAEWDGKPGPYLVALSYDKEGRTIRTIHVGRFDYAANGLADKRFIAAARTAVPSLIAEVERLRNDLHSVKPAMQAEQRRHAKARQDMHAAKREVERLREALYDIEGKCADAIGGRINYRAGDLQIIARTALQEPGES